MGHWYKKGDRLYYKSNSKIYAEGAVIVLCGMIVALLCVLIFK